jgi:site-specific DNA recombinase
MEEQEAKTIDDNDDVGRAWAERLRARFVDLENQRRAKLAELDELRIVAEREQPQQPELLDMLPELALDLADAPDPLQRGLYEACGMKIYYDHTTRNVTIRATLRAETVPAVEQAAAVIALTSANTDRDMQVPPQPTSDDDVAHVLRVLPGARKHGQHQQAGGCYSKTPSRCE